MQIINGKYDDGSDVVKKFNWVTSCGVCTRKGIAEKCTHIARPIQHFQSIQSHARLSKLLSADDYLREVLYVSVCLSVYVPLTYPFHRNQVDAPLITYAFDKVWIDAMVNSTYRLNEDIQHLFITIDPASGKDQNLYVLCSTVFTKDGTQVVCLSFFIYCKRNMYSVSHSEETSVANVSASWSTFDERNSSTLGRSLSIKWPVFWGGGGWVCKCS